MPFLPLFASTTTPVTATRATTWNVAALAKVTATRSTTWNVTAPPPSPTGLISRRNAQAVGFAADTAAGTHRVVTPISITATGVKLTYVNWRWSETVPGEANSGNTLTLGDVFFEYGGTAYRVTFGGSNSYVMASGETVTSDAIAGLTVTAGTTGYVRTYMTVPAGGQWPNAYGVWDFPNELSRPGTNLANGTGDLSGTGQTFGTVYAPVRVTGIPSAGQPRRALVVIGDSIIHGTNDSFSNPPETGYWQRRLYPSATPNYAYQLVSHSGESAFEFNDSGWGVKRLAFVGPNVQYVVNGYGINDLQEGRTLASLQASIRAIAVGAVSRNPTVRVMQQTLTPKTSSTDGWATTTNQTTDGINTTRVAFNNWVRDGMPEISGVAVATGTSGALRAGQAGHPFWGYVEIADLAESARNSGIWKANYTPDGVHPNPTGNAAIAAGLDLSFLVDVSGGTSVTATRATTWDTLASAASSRATTWDARTVVTATRATTWDVRTVATSTRATTWDALAAATSTRSTTWRARATVTATRSTTWRAQATVSSSRATTWDVNAGVSSTRATTWNVNATGQVTATRSTTFDVLARITTTKATTWDTLTPVTATRSTTADVLQTVTSARTTTWNVVSTVPTTQVTATRTTTWDVRTATTATRVASFDVRTLIASTRATSWDTLAQLSLTRPTTWDVLTTLSTTRSTTWDTRSRQTSTRTTTWNVTGAPVSAGPTARIVTSRITTPTATGIIAAPMVKGTITAPIAEGAVT